MGEKKESRSNIIKLLIDFINVLSIRSEQKRLCLTLRHSTYIRGDVFLNYQNQNPAKIGTRKIESLSHKVRRGSESYRISVGTYDSACLLYTFLFHLLTPSNWTWLKYLRNKPSRYAQSKRYPKARSLTNAFLPSTLCTLPFVCCD